MPINKLFGGNISLAGKALDLRMERQGLIQSNIANLETPGYRAKELPFARVLQSMTAGTGELVRTNPRHIAPDPVEAQTSRFVEEGGPVDLDEEMVNLSENQLMYQVATRIVAKKLEGIQYAIDEGGK
ncbi:MAG: flagellar basal body rod protein FlgB [Desulfobacteraceae bacterium]|nr:flagellar basal body rod protein FlgB [Desulfobacteraceae bacterium]